jgi:hypothetical protein
MNSTTLKMVWAIAVISWALAVILTVYAVGSPINLQVMEICIEKHYQMEDGTYKMTDRVCKTV